MFCEVKKIYYHEDHELFAAEVISGECFEKEAMVYQAEKFF